MLDVITAEEMDIWQGITRMQIEAATKATNVDGREITIGKLNTTIQEGQVVVGRSNLKRDTEIEVRDSLRTGSKNTSAEDHLTQMIICPCKKTGDMIDHILQNAGRTEVNHLESLFACRKEGHTS